MKFRSLGAAILSGGIIASAGSLPRVVQAAPIVGGITEVRLDAAPVLGSLEIAVGLIGTATLLGTPEISPGVNVPLVGFPITGGTANGSLVIEHDGSGLSLSRDTNGIDPGGVVVVSLTNFVIDTGSLALAGDVSVDGTGVGSLPLFIITTTGNADFPFALNLSFDAAAALNASFGVTAFTEGLTVAVATTAPDVAVSVPATGLLFGAAIAPLLAWRRRAS